jgi:hypothetical protein
MILRVYAMWNQSKMILYILSFINLSQVIISFVGEGIYNNPNTYLSGMSPANCELNWGLICGPLSLTTLSPVTIVQVIDVAFCNISVGSPPSQLLWCIVTLRLVLGAILSILAVTSSLKESVMMYKATKKWQPNHYMQLFVKDGILYFLVYVSPLPFLSVPFITIIFSHPCYSQLPATKKLITWTSRNIIFNVTEVWLQDAVTTSSTSQLVVTLLSFTTLCPIMPRFIISVRELYDHDLHGRWQGIDTGFGVLSQPVFSGNAAVSAIQFADVVPGQDLEEGEVADDSEAIRLEMRDGTRRV